MAVVELDQYLNRLEGRDAVVQKIDYIVQIMKGEIPYSDYGNPVKVFAYDSPDVKSYMEGRLAANGIYAQVALTAKGRITVYDTEVLYEGDL